MNQLWFHVGTVKQAIAVGRAFTKPHIDCDNQVSLTKERFDIAKHPNTSIANIAWMVIIADIMKAERRHQRQVISPGKGLKLTRSIAGPASTPIKDQRASRSH